MPQSLTVQHAMNPKPIQSRLLNEENLEGFSVRADTLCLSSDSHANSAAMIPSGYAVLRHVFAAHGESEMINQVERLNSNEKKIAQR